MSTSEFTPVEWVGWYRLPGWEYEHRLDPNILGYTLCGRSILGLDVRPYVQPVRAFGPAFPCTTCLLTLKQRGWHA